MGQEWDGFESYQHYQDWVAQWSTLLIKNALYPGAVCLFFGGTRTFHHLGVGLERGGFEIVDSVLIPWMHGQGFPKAHEIEQGYYTALKPAWEPVFVCRAPRGDMTFKQLMRMYGTGGLNIDGSRIGFASQAEAQKHAEEWDRDWNPDVSSSPIHTWDKHTGNHPGQKREKGTGPKETGGRWPANLVLTHHEACVKVGEYMVEGRTINRFTQDMMPFGGAEGEEYETEEMPPDLVDWYACVPSCPVRALDDQAGEARSSMGGGTTSANQPGSTTLWDKPVGQRSAQYFDAGGPSRFFYTAKASRSEKDKGLEHYFWRRTSKGGWKRVEEEEWAKLPNKERARGCIHPTVKPLSLLRYLANLILPPIPDTGKTTLARPRRLLVPFSGSGSEMIAGLQAGWDIVEGVEMDETYTMIATDRINANIGMF